MHSQAVMLFRPPFASASILQQPLRSFAENVVAACERVRSKLASLSV